MSSGTVSPTFSSGTTSYTASVANGVTSLTITPTAHQANATITVNGTPVINGQVSGAITLNIGSNTVSTVVTAQDGVTTDTYTIIVTRVDPPAITNPISTALTKTSATL
ncbi:MAG: cadherin-like beta sandwich domain-containing protein [bacterium]